MPVIKCSNGKWKVGTGACIYETKEQAVKVYQAILASGKLKETKQHGNKQNQDKRDKA